MSKMSVCFCADGNYINYIPSVIESIERFCTTGINYYIITDKNISKNLTEKLESVTKNKIFDFQIDNEDYEGLIEKAHFTKAMYYRLSIQELIEDDIVLYLDCDILVRGDINKITDYELGDNLIGGVTNPNFNRHEMLQISKKNGYFNSGVMLINNKKWKEQNVKGQAVELLTKIEPEKLALPDQDVLNIICQHKWLMISTKYNMQYSILTNHKNLPTCEYSDLNNSLANPTIIHFSGSIKQWHSSSWLKYTKEYKSLSLSITINKKGFVLDLMAKIYHLFKYKIIYRNKFV